MPVCAPELAASKDLDYSRNGVGHEKPVCMENASAIIQEGLGVNSGTQMLTPFPISRATWRKGVLDCSCPGPLGKISPHKQSCL
ncbi:Hypothetical predicted protein [Podarcis lilfordi]|uniref:Uncharacterized protein n=1 Tax=Podarcis lilfordi TaxID=74358 RepID=A0AA35LL81_9SAUR|nr:Hypothetical predicted protein [Podarcis lilfordi]